MIHVFLDFGNLFVKQLLNKFSNVFWKDVFEFWFTVMKMQFNYNTKIELNPVWYNSQIKVDKKWGGVKEWYRKGVKLVSDFLI